MILRDKIEEMNEFANEYKAAPNMLSQNQVVNLSCNGSVSSSKKEKDII